ncbi:MAG TPA: LLM class F420-dependent oxidoreductase [Gammaproteobacteria bacterium]|nr:LLM class F420-dependent oxidoreductase [Gammaproteobacteria bacterium]
MENKKKLSLLQWTEGTTGSDLIDAVQRFENLGYHELWLPEIFGREPLSTAGYLLAKTERVRVSSGILNVFAHDADSAAQAANALAELSDGRFTLGLGVSHPVLVEPRGHNWILPAPKMRAYLDRLAVAPIESPLAKNPAPVVVAGHGPVLMRIAAEKADGSFVFLQTLETVKQARGILGPDKELHVAVRCILDADPVRARDLARRANAFYMSLPPYHKIWAKQGFTEKDWADGSDDLIDAICVWGDAETVKDKLEAYYDAGATHVVLYPANPTEEYRPDSAVSKQWAWDLLEALAPSR